MTKTSHADRLEKLLGKAEKGGKRASSLEVQKLSGVLGLRLGTRINEEQGIRGDQEVVCMNSRAKIYIYILNI